MRGEGVEVSRQSGVTKRRRFAVLLVRSHTNVGRRSRLEHGRIDGKVASILGGGTEGDRGANHLLIRGGSLQVGNEILER